MGTTDGWGALYNPSWGGHVVYKYAISRQIVNFTQTVDDRLSYKGETRNKTNRNSNKAYIYMYIYVCVTDHGKSRLLLAKIKICFILS